MERNEVELIFSWLENKPKNIILLLDSKKDGDSTSTFYNKCVGKFFELGNFVFESFNSLKKGCNKA